MDDADIYLAALKGDLGPLRDKCALYMEIQLAALGGDLGPLRNKALSGPLNRKARRSIAARERRIAMAEEARKILRSIGLRARRRHRRGGGEK